MKASWQRADSTLCLNILSVFLFRAGYAIVA